MNARTPFAPRSKVRTASPCAIKRAPKMRPDQLIIANLSGRGDKDVAQDAEFRLEGKRRRLRTAPTGN